MAAPLDQAFKYQGWTVHYAILRSISSTSGNSSPPRRLVFVHGTPWSSIVYTRIIQTLLSTSSDLEILLYDLPGYGTSQLYTPEPHTKTSSQGFDGNTSVRVQAECLTSLLHHTGFSANANQTPPAAIAHDIAGTIVLRAHLIHQIPFSKILLMDTNTVLPWGDGFYTLVRSSPETFTQLPPPIFEAMVRAVTRSATYTPACLAMGWEDGLVGPWTGKQEAQSSFVRQIAQAEDADVAEMLEGEMYGKVGCDVMVIWGEEDRWIPREKIEKMCEMMGRKVVRKVFVPEAGHLVMLDQPERVAVEVARWVGS